MLHDAILILYYIYTTTTTTPIKRPLFQDSMGKPVKGKTSLDLSEARDDGVLGCSGISWTICKQSALCSRQITPSLNFYRPDALPDAQPTVSKH